MKKHSFILFISIIIIIIDSSLASKFQNTAYFQALDSVFHTSGTQKIFIIRPKRCSKYCQQSIQNTQNLIRQMNLLRNVPFIVADAFATNQNLQIRLYDENGKLSGKIISEASQKIPESRIKKFLQQKLFSFEPKTKIQNKEGFPIQNIESAKDLIDKYNNQIKKSLSNKKGQFYDMNQRVFEPEQKSSQVNEQTDPKNDKEPIKQIIHTQPAISEQQIKNMIQQQMQNGVNRDQILDIVQKQMNKDTSLKTQIQQIKDKFNNLKKQLQQKQDQRNQVFENQKRSLQKQTSQNSRKQRLQKLTKNLDNNGIYFKACLLIIGILAIYIFFIHRKDDKRQEFQRLPTGQSSFERI